MQNEKAISRMLYGLYAVKSRRLRQFIKYLVTRLENGEMYSRTLRRIYRDYYNIETGLYSYGCFDEYRINAFTRIGRYCSFAEGVCVFTRNHPLEFVSTHPFFFNSAFGYVDHDTVARKQLVIGNDVWIGRNAMILPSVERIGDGAVIGAGAVVTRDVPDFSVAVGNPAAIIKFRFSEEERIKVKQSQWWDKDIEQLKDDMKLLNSSFKSFEQNEIQVG